MTSLLYPSFPFQNVFLCNYCVMILNNVFDFFMNSFWFLLCLDTFYAKTFFCIAAPTRNDIIYQKNVLLLPSYII